MSKTQVVHRDTYVLVCPNRSKYCFIATRGWSRQLLKLSISPKMDSCSLFYKLSVEHEMFACMKSSQISRNFVESRQELCKKVYYAYISMKSGLISLIMVRFSIRNHPWKAEDFMHTNYLWAKFTKFSCRENFMVYSILNETNFRKDKV